MANVTLTAAYAAPPGWSGNLLSAAGSRTATVQTATSYAFTLDNGPFTGYHLGLTGRDCFYEGSAALDGVVQSLTIRDLSLFDHRNRGSLGGQRHGAPGAGEVRLLRCGRRVQRGAGQPGLVLALVGR